MLVREFFFLNLNNENRLKNWMMELLLGWWRFEFGMFCGSFRKILIWKGWEEFEKFFLKEQ